MSLPYPGCTLHLGTPTSSVYPWYMPCSNNAGYRVPPYMTTQLVINPHYIARERIPLVWVLNGVGSTADMLVLIGMAYGLPYSLA